LWALGDSHGHRGANIHRGDRGELLAHRCHGFWLDLSQAARE